MHQIMDNVHVGRPLRSAAPAPRAGPPVPPHSAGSFLSSDRVYRYCLWRVWDSVLPRLCYIMLNPSTADESKDDATIRVCVGRAKHLGYGSIVVANLFALRSTNPAALYSSTAPVSHPAEPQRNAHAIVSAVCDSELVIAAWGKHGAYMNMGALTLSTLRGHGWKVYALKLNHDNSPAHPLRIAYDKPLLELQ